MQKKLIWGVMPLILILILSLSALASKTSYKALGEDEYQVGEGSWNGDLSTTLITTPGIKAMSDPRMVPLFEDLDNDGTEDIVVMDGNNILLYSDTTLDLQASFNYGPSQDTSNMLIHDIDSDSTQEIIFYADTSQQMTILSFNGSHLVNESYYDPLDDWSSGWTMIGCGDPSGCGLVYAKYESAIRENVRLYSAAFTSTEITTNQLISAVTSPVGGQAAIYCNSVFGTLEYDSINDKYAFAWNLAATSNQNGYEARGIWIEVLNHNGTHLLNDADVQVASATAGISNTDKCYDGSVKASMQFSNVLVDQNFADLSGSEYLLAFATSTGNFKIHAYDKDLNLIDDYPEILTGDGQLISNLILLDSFGSETETLRDACALGYDTADEEIELLCANNGGTIYSSFIDSLIYEFDISDRGYNITFDESNEQYKKFGLIHAGQYIGSTTSNHELITSYGTFSLDCGLLGCELEEEYIDQLSMGAVIPADVQNLGLNDYLKLTETTLYYVDDGFTNTGALIDAYNIDPCTNAPIKTNSSMQVSVTCTDANSDDVNARLSVYNQVSNEQNFTFNNNATSGSSFAATFSLNETGTNRELLLECWDSQDPTDIDSLSFLFSVSNTGVIEFGDCSESGSGLAEEEAAAVSVGTACTDTDDCSDGQVCAEVGEDAGTCQNIPTAAQDDLKKAADEIVFLMGLSKITFFFLIFLILNIFIIKKAHDSPNALIFSLIMGNIALLGLAWAIGLVSTSIVISVFVVGFFGAFLVVGKMIIGNGGGG